MRKPTSVLLLAVTAVALAASSACVGPRSRTARIAVEPKVTQSSIRFRKEYVLAPGDQIEVVVRRTPEASRVLVIRPDGFISLPMVDDVLAAGLTTSELDAKLTELLSKRLVDPDVTVIATQVRQAMVYVMGDVTTATAVPLRNAATAMQAVAYAGGLRRSASARAVTIIRLGDDGFIHALPVDAKVGGQPGPYIGLGAAALQPDDIVFVPENGRSQVARFLEDFINRPLMPVNAIVGAYVNFRLVQELTRN